MPSSINQTGEKLEHYQPKRFFQIKQLLTQESTATQILKQKDKFLMWKRIRKIQQTLTCSFFLVYRPLAA
jgi:hypothetical protein